MTAIGTRAVLIVALAVGALAIGGLAVAESLDVAWLVHPADRMGVGMIAAAVGVGLLVADIVLPVPSSVVMVAHGALFGIVPGAVLSLAGRTGNALVGVLLGRFAGSWLARRTPVRSDRGGQLIERWGLAAVVLTRPVPVLAESTVVAAGAAGLVPVAVVGAAALGAVPEAVLYAVAGATAASSASVVAVFAGVIGLAVVAAEVRRRLLRRRAAGPF